MLSRILLLFQFLVLINSLFAQPWSHEQLEVKTSNSLNLVMNSDVLFTDRWIELPQAKFWRKIMTLSPDSCVINVARNRMILEVTSFMDWRKQTDIEKAQYKAKLRTKFGLDSTEELYVTSGKSDFYRFHEVFPSLGKGIAVFESNMVDPWYAQAILLIESPAQLVKSVSGAYGAFQLMPAVAQRYGLIVNSKVDERADFDKSAFASSQLIKLSCIPSARNILKAHGLSFNENELWFRLLVMHVYHAGAGNVSAVVNKIKPTVGSMELIKQMWVTSAAGFGNNSQNYSQLAIAAQWLLHDYVYNQCDELTPCSGK
jgi:hypothetical protein